MPVYERDQEMLEENIRRSQTANPHETLTNTEKLCEKVQPSSTFNRAKTESLVEELQEAKLKANMGLKGSCIVTEDKS